MAAACDPAAAAETPVPEFGMRRYVRVEALTDRFTATWYDRFPGGCVIYRLHSTTDLTGQFAKEAPSLLGLTTREQLREALDQRSHGRLHLDPEQPPNLSPVWAVLLLAWPDLLSVPVLVAITAGVGLVSLVNLGLGLTLAAAGVGGLVGGGLSER
jgi:hypothetical protein